MIQKYKNKLNLKYYKTGKLNMLNNWDKGYQLSNAQYCYLITDKTILDPDTAKTFKTGTKHFPPCNIFLFSFRGEKEWQTKSSETLLKNTLEEMNNFYNACGGCELKPFLKREYKNFLIQKYGRLIHFVGGDVDVVYLALMNDPIYASVSYNAIKDRSSSVGSVGRSGEYGGNIYKKYLEEHGLNYDNLYPEAPVNIPNNFNGMYHDLFATAKLCGYPINADMINKVNYIVDLYISLLTFERRYHTDCGKWFLALHNYIEENNLQLHPEINRCFSFYSCHYTTQDYRTILSAKSHSPSRWLEKIFAIKNNNGVKTVSVAGVPLLRLQKK